MTYTPKKDNRPALLLSMLLIFFSMTFFFVSCILAGYISRIFSLAGLIFFLAAFIIITRFLIYSYTYSTDGEEFEVIQKSNKSYKKVCLLYCTEITEVTPKTEAKHTLHKIKRYDYRVSLFPKNTYCIFFEENGEKCVIFLECSHEFANYLKLYTQKAPFAELL